MFWITLLAFFVILGLLIFVHELGHFAVAKLAKIKVEEFAFGFPPRVFCRRWGETKYCVNAIPFGGYVKMLGEEKSSESPRAFGRQKARWRLAVVVAGVFMNLVLAGALLSMVFMIGASPIRLDPEGLGGERTAQVVIVSVNEDSPAKRSDLEPGDTVVGFTSAEDFASYTRANAGEEVVLSIERDGEARSKRIVLSDNPEGPLGAGIGDFTKVKLPFFQAIGAGFSDAYMTTTYIIGLLWEFFSNIFKPGEIGRSVAGPVKIFAFTGEAVKMGLVYLAQFAALLSINVALVNILPFPALDGGRAVIIVAEGIFRRKLMKTEVENILHVIGFVLLITLILMITFKEIAALF